MRLSLIRKQIHLSSLFKQDDIQRPKQKESPKCLFGWFRAWRGGNCSTSNFLTCWTSAHQCIAHPSCTVSPGRTQTAAEPCSVPDCAQQRQISLNLTRAGDLRSRLMTGDLFSAQSCEQFRKKRKEKKKRCVDFKACRLQREGQGAEAPRQTYIYTYRHTSLQHLKDSVRSLCIRILSE